MNNKYINNEKTSYEQEVTVAQHTWGKLYKIKQEARKKTRNQITKSNKKSMTVKTGL